MNITQMASANENPTNVPKMAICVMTCTTKEKYQLELVSCLRTWFLDCLCENIPCYFFTGEAIDEEYENDIAYRKNIIHLEGVGDDYMSASHKQWKGLKYITENIPCDFALVVDTNNYVNIKNAKKLLEKYNPSHPFLISGKYQYKSPGNIRYQMFPLGGNGIFLSKKALSMFPYDTIHEQWSHFMAKYPKEPDYSAACDVAMAYYSELYGIVLCKDYGMFNSNPLSIIPTNEVGTSGAMQCTYGEKIFSRACIFHHVDAREMQLYNHYKHVFQEYITLKTLCSMDMRVPSYHIGILSDSFDFTDVYSHQEALCILLGMVDKMGEKPNINFGTTFQCLKPLVGKLLLS